MDGLSGYKGLTVLVIGVLALILLGCQKSSPEKVGSGIRWIPYEEAIQRAKESGKPVVIVFVSYTCPVCDKLEEETLGDPDVSALLNEEFLPVRILAEETPSLVQRFRVFGFPTIWFYKEGNLFGPLVGFIPPDAFRDILFHVLSGGGSP